MVKEIQQPHFELPMPLASRQILAEATKHANSRLEALRLRRLAGDLAAQDLIVNDHRTNEGEL